MKCHTSKCVAEDLNSDILGLRAGDHLCLQIKLLRQTLHSISTIMAQKSVTLNDLGDFNFHHMVPIKLQHWRSSCPTPLFKQAHLE